MKSWISYNKAHLLKSTAEMAKRHTHTHTHTHTHREINVERKVSQRGGWLQGWLAERYL